MKLSISIVLCALPFLGFSQKKDTVIRYLDQYLHFTSRDEAVYYGVSFKQNDHWFLYALYPDTTPVCKVYFKDKKMNIKDGLYEIYYPKNKLAKKGYFTNNQMNGTWLSWYTNGVLKDSGNWENDIKVSLWKTWAENGNLKESTEYKEHLTEDDFSRLQFEQMKNNIEDGIKNGKEYTFYENGVPESAGQYNFGQKEGEWKWYYENGKLSTVEQYQKGKVISMVCYDSTGTETGDFCSIQKPALLKEYGDYREFIMQTLEWPKEAIKNRLTGAVKVHIKVDKQGKLSQLKIESNQDIFKKAVVDLFKKMGDWEPAVSHNRTVEWEDELVIPFN